MEEQYFVISSGDEPERLFFNKEEAFAYEANYVDSFDNNGERVIAYKFIDGIYVTDF
ncbi:hypothetical protein KAR91_18450 [Candidatus Pacearchaeota archaeon]|nr:hypothetical protein [Candidatus Pacearchaeota archaeon]